MDDRLVVEADFADKPALIEEINLMKGPYVVHDAHRGYGLMADKDYKKGEVVTRYGGLSPVFWTGDYVARLDEHQSIDGISHFKLSEKGRWLNEHDAKRSFVNVILGRECRAACDIKQGQMLYTDYGPDYDRKYN